MFVADFPGGASATVITGITVENRLPYGTTIRAVVTATEGEGALLSAHPAGA